MIDRVLRYARTVRHLRAGQLVALIASRSRSRSHDAPVMMASIPSTAREAMADEMAHWGYPWPADRAARLVNDAAASRFSFAGTTLSYDTLDWRGRMPFPLWAYEFHYLEPLEALAWTSHTRADLGAAHTAFALMQTWQERARGGVGWDAYPVSVRSTHWSTALLLAGHALSPAQQQRVSDQLRMQIEHLTDNLETHLLANHLLTNLCALSRAGLMFAPDTVPWLPAIRMQYQEQLASQFANDGFHEERTPTYHAILVRSALEEALLRRAAGGTIGSDETSRLRRMLQADALLRRNDGSPRLLNDSVECATPSREYLERLYKRLDTAASGQHTGAFWLRNAAFAGYRGAHISCVLDAGEPSPPWQPGHAHCGALSFELDAGDRPIIVDSGLHGYDGDALREYVRSTRAHNTVSIDGREQGECWGTFRMARRWKVHEATLIADPGAVFAFRAAISPYWSQHLRHIREWRVHKRGLAVTDTIAGANGATAESFLHLHPQLSANVEGMTVTLTADGHEIATITCTGFDRLQLVRGRDRPAQGWYCSDFGVRQPSVAIVAQVNQLSAAHTCGYTIVW